MTTTAKQRTEALLPPEMDLLADPVYMLNPTSLEIVDCNKAATDMLGYDKTTLKGMRACDFSTQAEQDLLDPASDNQADEGLIPLQYSIHRTSDGRQIPVEVRVREHEIGGECYDVAIVRDISEILEQNKKLDRYYHLYRGLLNTIPVPVFYKDVDGRYLGCNPAFSEFTGLNEQDLVGLTVFDLFDEDKAKRYQQEDNELLEDQGVQAYEAFVPNRLGQDRLVGFYKSCMLNKDNEVEGIVGAYLDLTERRKMEIRLTEERNYIKKLLDLVNVMIVSLDREGQIVQINQYALDLMGYESAEVLGKNWFDLALPEEQLKEVKQVFNTLMVGDDHSAGEFRNAIRCKDGSLKQIYWRNSFLIDQDGKYPIKGILSAGIDITDD